MKSLFRKSTRKLIAFCCVIAVLSCVPSVLAEVKDITFLDIPWFASVEDAKTGMNSLTNDLPTGAFEIKTWNALNYDGKDTTLIENVPTYTLTYEGRYYYQVAGFNVKSVEIDFVPVGTDGVYSDKDFSDYQMVRACYNFDKDNRNSYKDIYNALSQKLTALYGEPSDTYSSNEYGAATFNREGLVWLGDNNTMVKLHYGKAYSSWVGTMEGVILTYYSIDTDIITATTELHLGDSTTQNIDVGAVNGL